MLTSSVNTKRPTKLVRFVLFFSQLLIASLITFLVASTLHTQSVMAGLISIGAEIPFALRMKTVFVDYIGLLPTYGIIIFIGMLIAMFTADIVAKTLQSKRSKSKSRAQESKQIPQIWVYALAGSLAIYTILAAMHPIMDITLIAGARGFSGLLAQSIAGAIGGTAFAVLRSRFS